jgi:tRNA-specific 2-thiouridylase
MFRPGAIVDALTGATVGGHTGLANYTIGQRKGLGLKTSHPLYVLDLDPEHHTVVVGDARLLDCERLTAGHANFVGCDPPETPLRVQAKIRHRQAPADATVRALGADRVEVVFDAPQRAVTPGQSLVLYDGDRVVGGAVIERGHRA